MGNEMIKKVFDFETKVIDDNNRIIEFIGSSEAVDRDGDIIDVAGWKLDNYNKNPVFLFAHDYSSLPIGRSVKTYADTENKVLKFHIQFAGADIYPFADTVYKLYKGGFIKATSVGFRANKVEDRIENGKYAGRHYKEQELLELSAVPVPCNPEAVMMSVSKGLLTKEDTKAMKQKQMLNDEDLLKLWEDQEDWTEIRYRIRNPDLFVEGRFRRSQMRGVTPPIFMILGRLKTDPEGSMVLQSLRFPKPDWTLEKAKEWVKEHPEINRVFDNKIENEDTELLMTMADCLEQLKTGNEEIKILLNEIKTLLNELGKAVLSGQKPKDDAKSDTLSYILRRAKETEKILKN